MSSAFSVAPFPPGFYRAREGMKSETRDEARTDGRKKATDAQIVEALKAGWGIPRAVIEALWKAHGVRYTRSGLWRRIQASPALKTAEADARASGVDMAEFSLLMAVREKRGWAIKFFLEHNSDRYRPTVEVSAEVAPPRSAEELKAEAAKYGIHFNPDEGGARLDGPEEPEGGDDAR